MELKLKVCPDCGKIFSETYAGQLGGEITKLTCFSVEPVRCLHPNMFEVDDGFVPILEILWRKGYETENHCFGHMVSQGCGNGRTLSVSPTFPYVNIIRPSEDEYRNLMFEAAEKWAQYDIEMTEDTGINLLRKDFGADMTYEKFAKSLNEIRKVANRDFTIDHVDEIIESYKYRDTNPVIAIRPTREWQTRIDGIFDFNNNNPHYGKLDEYIQANIDINIMRANFIKCISELPNLRELRCKADVLVRHD